MGIENEGVYLKELVPNVTGQILEIGSRDPGGAGKAVNFRQLYEAAKFTGVDIENGPGVDVIWDFNKGHGSFEAESIDLCICCNILEHTPTPWVLAENISGLIKPGGLLYISVPWVWRYHPYPNDYWRISFEGVKSLFKSFNFGNQAYSTNVPGEIFAITAENLRDFENIFAMYAKQTKGGTVFDRKYLPYLAVLMIGKKQ